MKIYCFPGHISIDYLHSFFLKTFNIISLSLFLEKAISRSSIIFSFVLVPEEVLASFNIFPLLYDIDITFDRKLNTFLTNIKSHHHFIILIFNISRLASYDADRISFVILVFYLNPFWDLTKLNIFLYNNSWIDDRCIPPGNLYKIIPVRKRIIPSGRFLCLAGWVSLWELPVSQTRL